MQQGSQEWLDIRLGKLTASRIAMLYSGAKTYRRLKRSIVIERITGEREPFVTNEAIEWGVSTEPLARAAYEMANDVEVDLVGFVPHEYVDGFGCSPDGYVGADGLIEIKCPNTNTHLTYIQEDKPPKKYIPQMQAQMAVTGRKWCDFVSYDPRVEDDLQLFIKRVERDDQYIAEMTHKATVFLASVDRSVKRFERMKECQLNTKF